MTAAPSSANQLTEFRVQTECGRLFGWSAIDEESLRREMKEKGYQIIEVQPMKEWELNKSA
ncbi:hypothetical protein CJP46_35530 [Paenibacillus sp. XY044]|nr:hypothetical protein CJP46_35530 [Paenibacillus sp. XY044]